MEVAGRCSIVVWTVSGRVDREFTALCADCKPLQDYAPAEVCCVQMRSKKLGVIVPVMSYQVYMGLVE